MVRCFFRFGRRSLGEAPGWPDEDGEECTFKQQSGHGEGLAGLTAEGDQNHAASGDQQQKRNGQADCRVRSVAYQLGKAKQQWAEAESEADDQQRSQQVEQLAATRQVAGTVGEKE